MFSPLAALAQSASVSPPGDSANQPAAGQQPDGGNIDKKQILDLDIEQLAKTPVLVPSMDTPVSSVSREQSTVGKSAAAVFVITQEMIRRSGATNIPDVLRLAPGLEVAQMNSNTWAITARGFNGPYADKLLVMIDGRTVYSPISTGVHWDVQDVLLEDIERIEVVRGPGGTLWGANAVNGVISIITKKSQDTQGIYVMGGGGSYDKAMDGFRYGGKIGDDINYRVYGKTFDVGNGFDPNQPANDGWYQGHCGFRSDMDLDHIKMNTFTIQGDYYSGASGNNAAKTLLEPPYFQPLEGAVINTGENVLARYRHVTDENSDWTLQTYYDNWERDSTILNSERAKTYDVDFQSRFRPADRQEITWGAGYRFNDMDFPSYIPFTTSLVPEKQTYNVASQFAQDEITLAPDKLNLIVGCKLEENSYTGLEYQPTIRLLWTPDKTQTLWGSITRAVRIPCAVSRSVFITEPIGDETFLRVLGNDGYLSETLMAYEVGYRAQVTERFSFDIATFYNVYNDLEEVVPVSPHPIPEPLPLPPHQIIPMTFLNIGNADSYGVELATNFTVSQRWRLSANYTLLRLFAYDGLGDPPSSGNSPKHQFSLKSSWNLRENLDFDMIVRYVDSLNDLEVPSYITMDLRLAWRMRKNLELALVGRNLLQNYHYEFGQTADNLNAEITEVPRSVYATMTWRY